MCFYSDKACDAHLHEMKRSFSAIKRESNGYGSLIQPDFDALDFDTAWKPSEFSLVESVDLADAILSAEKPKDCKMMRQYLHDQLCQVPSGYDILGGKSSKIAKLADSVKVAGGIAEGESGCDFAKLAEDARELWEEMKPRDDAFYRQTDSCCTSMCSTLASAASTLSSSTFSTAFAESSPAHFGATPSFRMDTSTASEARPTSPVRARRNSAGCMPIATLAATSLPAPAEATVIADAAVTAACQLLLRALEHRGVAAAAAAPSPAGGGRGAPRGELEPFSLGPGCPGA